MRAIERYRHSITSIALLTVALAAPVKAAGDDNALRVSPGRVVFRMSPDGQWKSFGFRGERPLITQGGVQVFVTGADEKQMRLADAFDGGTRSVLSQPMAAAHEGARGGSRRPSSFPDDDNDGRVDEDALNLIDDDHDGAVDEDYAAIGDEMIVAEFAPRKGAAVAVRQECYAWSLAHIDAMVASAVTIRNISENELSGARVAIVFEEGERMALVRAPRIEGTRFSADGDGDLDLHTVVLEGPTHDLALVMFTPRAAGAGVAGAWKVEQDGSRLTAVSPSLGDLGPGQTVSLLLALVALPDDDLKAARAIHTAARTIIGDAEARFLPPPVPLTSRIEAGTPRGAGEHSRSGIDPFWSSPGRLEEALVVGSPNPFRDAIAIDYQVPERVTDEDGMEHTLSGPVATSVRVYNVAGRLVTTLIEAEQSPGRYRVGWTARNDTGENVASGVYYVKLTIGKRSVTQRMVQLK